MARKNWRDRFNEALQRLRQPVESVTRSARIDIESSNVDEIDAPSDIDELYDLYQEVGIIRKAINEFVGDVTKPGVRVTAEDDATEAWFNGDDENVPDNIEMPDGGFLDNCTVIAGEKQQPFDPFLESTVTNRWARGTVLVELLKDEDAETADGIELPRITGFKHIQPGTVSARTYSNTNILIDPEDTEAVESDDMTERGEAAAYVQFEDRSIVGRRRGGFDKNEVPLSQNDVHKQVLDPDIGGGEDFESGVFGTPITRAIADDAEEYKNIKRDRAKAIKRKAYGIWAASFDTEVIETPGANEPDILKEWDEDEQEEWVDDVGGLGPADIITHDGEISLDKWEPQVPELKETLLHYVNDILAPLPTPKYATAFGEDIANFVADQQAVSYDDAVKSERRYQERQWTQVFRTVAERHPDLSTEGLKLKIEPQADESPIRSLDKEEIEKIKIYADALNKIFPGGAVANLEAEVIRDMILQLPEEDQGEAMSEIEDALDIDEDDEQVKEQFDALQAMTNGGDGGET
jgi:hypothetical protein